MDFNFDVNAPTITGGGGGGSVTQVGTGTGLTGGPITTIGTILFASIPDMNLLANISGGTAPPIPNTLTAILDYVLDNTQGDLIYRNGTVWTFLAPGVSGQVLSSGGPAANPAWTDVGEGTVLSVDTGTGLTGGPITSTGTISLADITGSQLLANLTLGSAAPLPHTLTAIFDYILGGTQGDLIYRNGTVWTTLLPGTVGQVLTSGGGGANPSWETTGSGSVTSIDTGTGLTGGPITDTGTIEFANVPAGYTLANLTDIVAPPLPHTVSDVLDFDFTDIQGSILYRANAEWSYLIPNTAGYVLTSNGPNQNPAWLPGGGGGGIIGGENLGGGIPIFNDVSGSDLTFNTLAFGAGLGASLVDNLLTVTNTGSGGFAYEDTFWVAQNGDDANSGLSINSPKLTIAGAIAAFTSPTTPSLINIVDDGLYTINHTTVTSQRMGIYGPAARLQSLTADVACFTAVSASTVVLSVATVQNLSGGDVLTLSGGLIQIDVFSIFGNVSGGGTLRGYFDSWSGDGSLTGGQFYLVCNIWNGGYTATSGLMNLIANQFSGPCNLSGSASITGMVGTTGAGFAVSNLGTGYVIGNFNNPIGLSQYYGNGINLNDQFIAQEIDKTTVVTGAFSPGVNDSNTLFIYNSNSNASCTLIPYGINPNYPIGYKISVCQQQAGNVEFVSGDPIESVQNRRWTEGRGAIVTATIMAIGPNPMAPDQTAYFFSLSGQVAGSAITTGLNSYVSQLIGDDTTGIGSLTQPFATIGAAYASLEGVTNRANVVIIDDQVYAESLTFDNGNISLIGPQATVIQGGGPDTITCTFMGSAIQIVLQSLGNFTSGNCLNVTGENQIQLQVNTIESGTVTQDNDGLIYIQAIAMDCDCTCTGTGTITYITSERIGNDNVGSGVINGISNGGVTGNFGVKNNLSAGSLFASGLNYPSVDGIAGQVVTTDGDGNLSLQSPASVLWSGISGTTQAATVNGGYVIENAAQTTVTLPAAAVKGNTVIVKGLGAAGWILAANIGQTIVSPALSTSSGGTLTSANQYDSISVTCIEDNTIWSLDWTTSTGLTPT